MAGDVLSLVGDVIGVVFALASQAIFLYAAYWALTIRRALAVRIYRNQALGVGLISLTWIIVFINYVVVSVLLGYVAYTVVDVLVWANFLYFIDASVLDGRQSDPLLRDTLHWRSIRRWVWGIFVASALVSIPATAYYVGVTGGDFSTLSPLLTNFLLTPYSWLVGLIGLVALPITAARSKDPLLRRQLVWFSGFIVAVAAVGLGNIVSASEFAASSLPAFLLFGFLLAGGYCLYKSAKSLVPLNRLGPLNE
jgi:hypothetical protein